MRRPPSPDIEQADSDLSFFMRSPSLKGDNSDMQGDEDSDNIDDIDDDAFNDLLLDQDRDNFLSPIKESQLESLQTTKPLKPPQIPKIPIKNIEIPEPKNTNSVESEDGDLEITGVQETERRSESKRMVPGSSKKIANVRRRSTTTRPVEKIRKGGTQAYVSKLPLFSGTDKSLEPLLAAISNLQKEKQHLQSELNSYAQKFEMSESKLARITENLSDVKSRTESHRDSQNQLAHDLAKLNEQRAEYRNQMDHIKSERMEVHESLKNLKSKTLSIESSNQLFTGKLRALAHELSTSKIPFGFF